jgi:hypothetical protein
MDERFSGVAEQSAVENARCCSSFEPVAILTNTMNPPPLSPLDISKKDSSDTEASDRCSSSSEQEEARCIVHEPRPKGGYSPCSERLIVESRVLQRSASGKYWVDITDGTSEDLAVRVSKVACMLVTRVRNSTTRKNDHVYG